MRRDMTVADPAASMIISTVTSRSAASMAATMTTMREVTDTTLRSVLSTILRMTVLNKWTLVDLKDQKAAKDASLSLEENRSVKSATMMLVGNTTG